MAMTSSLILFVFLGVLVSGQSPPSLTSIGGSLSSKSYFLNAAGSNYVTTTNANEYVIASFNGSLYTISNGGQYIAASTTYTFNPAPVQPYNLFQLTQLSDGTWNIYSPYLAAQLGFGYMCITSSFYGPYSPYFSNNPYSFVFAAAPTIAPTTAPTPAPTPAPTSPPTVGSSVVTAALQDSVSGGYLNAPSNPYLATSPVPFDIQPAGQPATGQPQLYSVGTGGAYLSAISGGNGYSSDGPDQSYNQFEFQPQPDGSYLISSPYLSAQNSPSWVSSLQTTYGPYLTFTNVAGTWTLVQS